MSAGLAFMGLNCVIDISHHNGVGLDFVKAKANGIEGVIHKSTQGITFRDKMYVQNRQKALDAGLMFGAYHFGTNERGSEQADHFLSTVNPDPQTLLVLDYEPNYSSQSTMRLDDAREFVETIAAMNGDRYPGLYSGHLIKDQLRNKPKDEILSQCFLWIAQYGPKVTNIPTNTWPTWTLWQYTEDGHVPGIGYCDRNRFNGGLAQLQKLWGIS